MMVVSVSSAVNVGIVVFSPPGKIIIPLAPDKGVVSAIIDTVFTIISVYYIIAVLAGKSIIASFASNYIIIVSGVDYIISVSWIYRICSGSRIDGIVAIIGINFIISAFGKNCIVRKAAGYFVISLRSVHENICLNLRSIPLSSIGEFNFFDFHVVITVY